MRSMLAAGALKKNAKDIDNDLTEEEKQNLVKANPLPMPVIAALFASAVAHTSLYPTGWPGSPRSRRCRHHCICGLKARQVRSWPSA